MYRISVTPLFLQRTASGVAGATDVVKLCGFHAELMMYVCVFCQKALLFLFNWLFSNAERTEMLF